MKQASHGLDETCDPNTVRDSSTLPAPGPNKTRPDLDETCDPYLDPGPSIEPYSSSMHLDPMDYWNQETSNGPSPLFAENQIGMATASLNAHQSYMATASSTTQPTEKLTNKLTPDSNPQPTENKPTPDLTHGPTETPTPHTNKLTNKSPPDSTTQPTNKPAHKPRTPRFTETPTNKPTSTDSTPQSTQKPTNTPNTNRPGFDETCDPNLDPGIISNLLISGLPAATLKETTRSNKAALYLRHELGVDQLLPTVIYHEDNNGAHLMTNAQQPTRRTRHVELKQFAVLQWVDDEQIIFGDIGTAHNISDSLTIKQTGRTKSHQHHDILIGRLRPQYARHQHPDHPSIFKCSISACDCIKSYDFFDLDLDTVTSMGR